MNALAKFHAAKRPLVAILRGIKPAETHDVVSALIDEGLELIEIPLNSPDAFSSIEIAAKLAPDNVLIGAGTVLSAGDVDQLHNAGGELMVSPNIDANVMARAGHYNMVSMPGVFSPSEALLAIKCGAVGLKFFPASVLGPQGIKAIMAVLPPEIVVAAVGGVSESNFAEYHSAGISAFGLGSSLYKPGASAMDVKSKAANVIAAYDANCS